MKTARKAILLVLCAILLVVSAVMGTLAYLTDTEAVTNTFTVGKVDITLDEFDYDNDDNENDNTTVNGEPRDKANEYHLLPGGTYKKDPTVTVADGSEEAYVFMTVTVKNLTNLKSALPENKFPGYYSNGIFLLQNLCDWQADSPWLFAGYKDVVADGAATTDGEYRFYYNATPAGGTAGNRLPALFTEITVPGADITTQTMPLLKDVEINVEAVAIQKAGFNTANDAWKAQFNEEYIIAPVAP